MTRLVTNSRGPLQMEAGYKPFGEVRYAWKDPALTQTAPAYALTKWTFTGQYSYADDPSTPGVDDFGLIYFNARFYDPALGRFSSADTLIPSLGDPQAWDRYAYGLNNPIRYNDPSGHCAIVLCPPLIVGGILLLGAFVAAEVALNPEVHDKAVESISGVIENLSKQASDSYTSTNTENKINDFEGKVQSTNSGKSFPTGPCLSSAEVSLLCLTGIAIGTSVVLKLMKRGGCGEDESNSACPQPGIGTATSTPTTTSEPPPTSAPDMSCAPRIECPPIPTPTLPEGSGIPEPLPNLRRSIPELINGR